MWCVSTFCLFVFRHQRISCPNWHLFDLVACQGTRKHCHIINNRPGSFLRQYCCTLCVIHVLPWSLQSRCEHLIFGLRDELVLVVPQKTAAGCKWSTSWKADVLAVRTMSRLPSASKVAPMLDLGWSRRVLNLISPCLGSLGLPQCSCTLPSSV